MDALLASPIPPLGNAAMDNDALGPAFNLETGATGTDGGGMILLRRAAGGDASSSVARVERIVGRPSNEGFDVDDIDIESEA